MDPEHVDLAKVYMEIGTRFLESHSDHFELNGINADEYILRARNLFREIDVMSHLD